MSNKHSKLVSVVIPAYNVSGYIEECIASVQAQSYTYFEVFIINDGSTDNTSELIEQAISQDVRFKLINQINLGQSAARNTGFDLCKGEFIYFLDSDDRIIEDFFQEAVEKMERDKLDMLTFNAQSFMEGCISPFNADTYVRDVPSTVDDPIQYLLKTEQFRCPVWLFFYRRKLLLETNLRFNEGILHEDESFSLIVSVSAKEVSFSNVCYVEHRVREGSIMTSRETFKNMQGYFEVFKETATWYINHNISETVLYSPDIKSRIAMFYLWALRGAIERGELSAFKKMVHPHLILVFKLTPLKNALAIIFPSRLCRLLST